MTIPPDFKKAENHGKANLIRNLDLVKKSSPEDFCKCCGNPIAGDDANFALCCSPLQFSKSFGPGYSMFFEFKKNMMLGLLFLTIFASFPCIIIILATLIKNEDDGFSDLITKFVTKFSTGTIFFE